MPTTPARARRWLEEGKAVVVQNALELFQVQLTREPSGRAVQAVVLGLDPGKLYSGVAVQSARATHYLAHLELPFPRVKENVEQRAMLRRGRRYRKCRTRPARFDNRRSGEGPPPSIRANRQLELRVVKELSRIFPLAQIYFEVVKAKGSKSFSPVMVGQRWMLEQLRSLCPTNPKEGWQTAQVRKHLGLVKERRDKGRAAPETHAVDGVALAASHLVHYRAQILGRSYGHVWSGAVKLTRAPFAVIRRPPVSRRQLHLQNPAKGGYRRAYGGTTTPFGVRKGDRVQAERGFFAVSDG
jgi:hypothetical protein